MISTAKLTERVLQDAVQKYIAYEKESKHSKAKDVTPHGRQTVKQLISQGQGASNIEASDLRLAAFDRVARKYGIDYAVKKGGSQHLIFFKAKDADALNAAFKEYSAAEIQRGRRRESVIGKLRQFTQLIKRAERDPVKNKNREKSL